MGTGSRVRAGKTGHHQGWNTFFYLRGGNKICQPGWNRERGRGQGNFLFEKLGKNWKIVSTDFPKMQKKLSFCRIFYPILKRKIGFAHFFPHLKLEIWMIKCQGGNTFSFTAKPQAWGGISFWMVGWGGGIHPLSPPVPTYCRYSGTLDLYYS